MARVLVTGGAGFIGSHVCRRLAQDSHDVAIYDKFVPSLSAGSREQKPGSIPTLADLTARIRIVDGDVLNKDLLQSCIHDLKPEVVIHLAGAPLVEFAVAQPEAAFQAIISGTQTLLEIIRSCGWACRLAAASSSLVYGNFQSEEIAESHPRNPTNIYGALKLAAEALIDGYAKTFQIDTVIFRPSAVYGPFDTNKRIVGKWIRMALENKPISIDGDGSLRMDFTNVEDCAEGIVACAVEPAAKGEVFNISYGRARSLMELTQILRAHFPDLQIERREKPPHVPVRGTLDINHARRILAFNPKVSLEEGVRRYVDHLRRNPY